MVNQSKILLVTGDERLAEEFKRIVEPSGIEWERCASTDGLARSVTAASTALVVLDGQTEETDLLDALRSLNDPELPRDVGALVIVSDVDDNQVLALLGAGADDVVSRRLRPVGLLARLKTHIKRVRATNALARKVRDSETLMEITSRLMGSGKLLENLYAVASFLSVELDVTRCSVVLVRPERDLGLVIASSDDPEVSSLAIDLRRYPEIQQVARDGKPLVVPDVTDSEILEDVLRELESVSVTSVALFPIARDDEVLGVIFLRFSRKRVRFEQRELVFCQTVANATAIALRNNEILESLRAKTQEVEQVQSEARSQVNALKPYEDFFVSSSDGMVVLSDSGVVLFVNPQGSTLLGRPPENIRGFPLAEMLAPSERARLESLVESSSVDPHRALDIRLVAGDGAEKIVSISAGSIGRQGMTLLTMRDVTHERLTARRLVDAQERLIESEKKSAMMEVAGGAAHELNQPLTSLMTSLSMLRRLMDDAPERTQRLVGTMETETERMASIIRRLSKLTEYTTKTYIGSARIIDLEGGSGDDGKEDE